MPLKIKPGDPDDKLEDGYGEFETDYRVRGVGKITDKRLDVLSVISHTPGGISRFFGEMKREYAEIYVWMTWEPQLRVKLYKLAFERIVDTDPKTNDPVDGFRWRAANHPLEV